MAQSSYSSDLVTGDTCKKASVDQCVMVHVLDCVPKGISACS